MIVAAMSPFARRQRERVRIVSVAFLSTMRVLFLFSAFFFASRIREVFCVALRLFSRRKNGYIEKHVLLGPRSLSPLVAAREEPSGASEDHSCIQFTHRRLRSAICRSVFCRSHFGPFIHGW